MTQPTDEDRALVLDILVDAHLREPFVGEVEQASTVRAALQSLSKHWIQESTRLKEANERGHQVMAGAARLLAPIIDALGDRRMELMPGEVSTTDPEKSSNTLEMASDPFRDPRPSDAMLEVLRDLPPPTEDPFVNPTTSSRPSSAKAVDPAWLAHLSGPPPVSTAPTHRSVSQVESYSDCGLRYRLERREVDVKPQRPAWWNVGGKAFHAAVEDFERDGANAALSALQAFWRDHLAAQVVTQVQVTDVKIDDWRTAQRGAEGYTWWLVEGEEMLRKYIAGRNERTHAGTLDTALIATTEAGPMLEWPFELDIDGVMDHGVIDQVRMQNGHYVIIDLKAGKSLPTDTLQLGSYAHAVVRHFGLPPSAPVFGSYYSARKGTYSEPVDMIARHPWEEIVYRFHTMDNAEKAGIYLPRVSPFCVSCGVSDLCPVKK